MKILSFVNVNEVASAVEKEMRRLVRDKKKLNLFVPTGKTPQPLYKKLREDRTFWKEHLSPIQIDEFNDPDRPFLKDLEREIGKPLGVNINAWNPQWTPKEIMAHIDTTLNDGIELALLGLGPNGHVGFHEPGLAPEFLGGPVVVEDHTRQRVGVKTNKAFTFGVGAFLKAKEIFLLITGPEKKEIFAKLKESEPTPTLPASLLKRHDHLIIFTDLA